MHRAVGLSQFPRAVSNDHSYSRLVVGMAGEVLVSRLAPDKLKAVTALTLCRASRQVPAHIDSHVHFPELNVGWLELFCLKGVLWGLGCCLGTVAHSLLC